MIVGPSIATCTGTAFTDLFAAAPAWLQTPAPLAVTLIVAAAVWLSWPFWRLLVRSGSHLTHLFVAILLSFTEGAIHAHSCAPWFLRWLLWPMRLLLSPSHWLLDSLDTAIFCHPCTDLVRQLPTRLADVKNTICHVAGASLVPMRQLLWMRNAHYRRNALSRVLRWWPNRRARLQALQEEVDSLHHLRDALRRKQRDLEDEQRQLHGAHSRLQRDLKETQERYDALAQSHANLEDAFDEERNKAMSPDAIRDAVVGMLDCLAAFNDDYRDLSRCLLESIVAGEEFFERVRSINAGLASFDEDGHRVFQLRIPLDAAAFFGPGLTAEGRRGARNFFAAYHPDRVSSKGIQWLTDLHTAITGQATNHLSNFPEPE